MPVSSRRAHQFSETITCTGTAHEESVRVTSAARPAACVCWPGRMFVRVRVSSVLTCGRDKVTRRDEWLYYRDAAGWMFRAGLKMCV